MTENINDVPLSDKAIISDDRATVGMLRQALDGIADDAEVVIPFTLFGMEVEQLELGAVVVNADKALVWIVAVSQAELNIGEEILNGDLGAPKGDGVQAKPEATPFA